MIARYVAAKEGRGGEKFQAEPTQGTRQVIPVLLILQKKGGKGSGLPVHHFNFPVQGAIVARVK